MNRIERLDGVADYNARFGVETLHPLVSVIDYSTLKPFRRSRKCLGFYAVMLKDVNCGDLHYGRHYYDYQEGTLVFISPGQVIGNDDDGEYYTGKGFALLFHPDLLRHTPLAAGMKQYSFFSYEASESLHMSERERDIIVHCFHAIADELQRGVDRHSKAIIISHIEVMLNHCMRFYDRQFSTREHVHRDLLTRFERMLDAYFEEGNPELLGLPTVQYFADELHLSANYFGDVIKKETGRTPQEHIQQKLIDRAKDLLCGSPKSVSEIAYELGFKYPHHLSRMFKRNVGCPPNEFRLTS